MRNRILPAIALVLAAGTAAGGCSAAAAGTASGGKAAPGSSVPASSSATAAAPASAAVFGPHAPDPACVSALKAEQTLEVRQGKDQDNESALDQDFTNFASALSAAAQRETRPATAKAMTALANDYNALVQSQSGAEQLPDMNTVENDGTAFEKACSLCHNNTRFPARRLLSGPGGRPGKQVRGQVVQAVPFTENDVGEASLVVQVPWKPSEVEPPAAIVPL
jgi:hypothetical protein